MAVVSFIVSNGAAKSARRSMHRYQYSEQWDKIPERQLIYLARFVFPRFDDAGGGSSVIFLVARSLGSPSIHALRRVPPASETITKLHAASFCLLSHLWNDTRQRGDGETTGEWLKTWMEEWNRKSNQRTQAGRNVDIFVLHEYIMAFQYEWISICNRSNR